MNSHKWKTHVKSATQTLFPIKKLWHKQRALLQFICSPARVQWVTGLSLTLHPSKISMESTLATPCSKSVTFRSSSVSVVPATEFIPIMLCCTRLMLPPVVLALAVMVAELVALRLKTDSSTWVTEIALMFDMEERRRPVRVQDHGKEDTEQHVSTLAL